GVRQLSRDIETESRAPGARGEERLEDLAAELRRDAGTVVVELADDGVAHVARARHDANAAFLLLAMLPGVAHEVPHDLVEMPAIEDGKQLVGDDDHHAALRNVLRLHDLVAQRMHELAELDHLRLLAVAAIELQHLAH